MERNETLWRLCDDTVLTATTVVGCYRELATAVQQSAGDDVWLARLATAMQHWADLFDRVPIPARPPQPRTPAGNEVPA